MTEVLAVPDTTAERLREYVRTHPEVRHPDYCLSWGDVDPRYDGTHWFLRDGDTVIDLSLPSPADGSGQTPTGGYATILIEENGVGGFGADFAEAGLGPVVKVVNSTNETKQNMYQRLIADLEGGRLGLPNNKTLIRQTTNLEKTLTPTGKAKYAAPAISIP